MCSTSNINSGENYSKGENLREVPILLLGFFSAFLDRSGGAGAEDDDGAAAFFNPGMGSGRGAGRLLVPGMTSCGLAEGCGAVEGAFFSGSGGCGDGLRSLWFGGGDGLGSLWIGGVGSLGSDRLGGGLRSRNLASRDCASSSFISAVSSCGGHRKPNQDRNFIIVVMSERGDEEERRGRTRDW